MATSLLPSRSSHSGQPPLMWTMFFLEFTQLSFHCAKHVRNSCRTSIPLFSFKRNCDRDVNTSCSTATHVLSSHDRPVTKALGRRRQTNELSSVFRA